MSGGVTLVGLSGPAGSGKSTAAEVLRESFGFYRLSFAEPIRATVLSIFDAWDLSFFDAPKKDCVCPIHGVSPRAALRAVGEHARALCPDIYVRACEAQLAGMRLGGIRRVVIDDVRMPHEAVWIREQDGHVVHVQRHGVGWSGEHPTECGPGEDWHQDLRLHNPGEMIVYRSVVRSLMAVIEPGVGRRS